MSKTLIATLVAAAFIITGCSTPQATAEPQGPPERGIPVNSINELKNEVEAAGITCDDYYLRELKGATGVEDFANCNKSLTFGTFESQSDAEAWAQTLYAMADGDIVMLVGDKWAMNASEESVDQLQAALGGTVEEDDE